jgi:hypothetical protein
MVEVPSRQQRSALNKEFRQSPQALTEHRPHSPQSYQPLCDNTVTPRWVMGEFSYPPHMLPTTLLRSDLFVDW